MFTKPTPTARITYTSVRDSKKALLATSVASLALMMAAVPTTAQAQVVVDVTSCEQLPVDNPAEGAGAMVNIDTNAECTVENGDIIELENNSAG